MDGDGIEGLQKEDVIDEDSNQAAEQRGPESIGNGACEHCRQENQGDVRAGQELAQDHADGERAGHHPDRAGIGLPIDRLATDFRGDQALMDQQSRFGLRRDHIDADVVRVLDQSFGDRGPEHPQPPGPAGFSDDDMGEPVAAGVIDDRTGDVFADNADSLAAQPLGQAQAIGHRIAPRSGTAALPGFDMDRRPGRAQPVREAAGMMDQSRRTRVLIHADEDSLAPAGGRAVVMRGSSFVHPWAFSLWRRWIEATPISGAFYMPSLFCGDPSAMDRLGDTAVYSGPENEVTPEVLAMPRLGLENGRNAAYLMLTDPRPEGPVVGFFRDRPIAAAVVDYFGRRYVFCGLASRRRNGQYDVDVLARGERLVEPGLVYASDGKGAGRG